MHVRQPSPYTPRRWRKSANRGAPKDPGKQRSFRAAKKWSDRFIHQKAKTLDNPKMAAQYLEWTEAARRGTLRKSTGAAKA